MAKNISANIMTNYNELAQKLKLMAHPERLQILDILRQEAECVCHLEALLGKPQPYISQQLRALREADIIVDEKNGLNVYYRLVNPMVIGWLEQILGPTKPAPARLISCPCPKCGSMAINLT